MIILTKNIIHIIYNNMNLLDKKINFINIKKSCIIFFVLKSKIFL